MSGSQTLRAEAPPAAPPALHPDAFRAGRDPDDTAAHMIDRVAFALAVERQTAPTAETLPQLRNEASVALTNFAFRHLHNAVTEIREQAIAEHRSSLPKPPGFSAMLLASVIGGAVVAAAVLWLQANPDAVRAFLG